MQPTCTMALGYKKLIFDWTVHLSIHLLGGGYEIYSPQIEQSDWTAWTYHGLQEYHSVHNQIEKQIIVASSEKLWLQPTYLCLVWLVGK